MIYTRRATWQLLVLIAAQATAQEQFPPELVRFKPHAQNPVFAGRGAGHWDARIRERGWILREGETYHLWYTGYDGERTSKRKLGYATSPDGIAWKRHPGNPIHEEHWVEDMIVLKDGATYYMFAEGFADQAHLLTSTDRITWRRVGPLDVRNKDGSPISPGPYGTPTVWLENGTWNLFYERSDLGVWLATSRDRKVWTNVQDEPVLLPGPGLHENKMIALNQIVSHGGRYYAYYHGRGDGPNWSTNIATSSDLIHWHKYGGNPLLPEPENKSSGILVHDGKQFRLYTMHDAVNVHVLSP